MFERSQARHGPNQQFSPRNLHQERWLLRRLVRCETCGLKCAWVAPRTPSVPYYRCEKQERVTAVPDVVLITSGPIPLMSWYGKRYDVISWSRDYS
ncbi:MAG: hypothetical protein ACRED0_09315 [Gammaproteobacteria bacterium]